MRNNPYDVTARIIAAQVAVQRWDSATWMAVVLETPECVEDNAATWCTTVEAFRTPGEPVTTAAARLALYLDLHAETYGRTPRLESVQAEASRRDATQRG